MREDMAKVIVERPRIGSRNSSDDPKGYGRKRYGKHKDLEDMPSKESMSRGRKYGYDCKQLNEHLRPLYRFLDKQIGRPWDKVFSEICERISMNSTVQRHIMQHVFDHVADKVHMGDDGIPMQHYSYDGFRPIYDTWYTLYVHPVDGLLKKVKKPKNWKSPYSGWGWGTKKKKEEARANGPDWAAKTCHQFHKLNGIWYVVKLTPIPLPLIEEVVFKDEDGEKILKVPNENGKLRDAMLGRQLYDLYDEEKDKEKPVLKSYPVAKTEGDGFGCSFYNETLSGLYGKKGIYACSYKQANGKELKWAGLKNAPQEAD